MRAGGLSALLSLGIVWLLALQCSAAAATPNAAAKSSWPKKLSQLWEQHGRVKAIRGHRRHRRVSAGPSPPPPAKLTQAQEFVKADTEAQDDFVRRCEVVVTVSDDKFLPVKPLDRFCQTTDAAMECRMKVGMRLKETHARDGDMGKFCGAVYDWFQGKYGMKCPKQCRKLQCKSTCMWLDAKKKLNTQSVSIKDDMLAAEKALKGLKALNKKVAEKAAEENKNKFAITMTNTKFGRAKAARTEKEKEQAAALVKVKKVNLAAANLEKTIAATEEKLIKTADEIMKKQFAIDKSKLTLENMARQAQRDVDRSKEDTEEETSLKAEAAKLDKELKELTSEMDKLKQSLANDKKLQTQQQGVLKNKVKKLVQAWTELDKFKVTSLMIMKPKHGLKQEEFYFEQGKGLPDFDATAPAVTKLAAGVNFPRTSEAWKDFFWKDNFAVRWSGVVLIKSAGDYTFSINSDDGSKLFIDGELLADSDGSHDMEEQVGAVTLSAGQHDIRLEYFEKQGDAGMVMKYQGPDSLNQMMVVPTAALQETRAVEAKDENGAVVAGVAGLTEEIFYFKQGKHLTMVNKMKADSVQTVSTVNVPKTKKNWPGLIANEDFALRYSGFLIVEKAGDYDFSLTSDDGSMLYIDNDVVVNNDGLHNMQEKRGKKKLAAGRHQLFIDYYQNKGHSGLEFKYSGEDSGNKMVVVPANHLQASSAEKTAFLQAESKDGSAPVIQPPNWQEEYHTRYYGNYRNHPSVDELKELMQNQFNRANAAQAILGDIENKMGDTSNAIKELQTEETKLKKQQAQANKEAGAAKKKADGLAQKAKDAQTAANKFKDDSVTKPLGELKKKETAMANEKKSLTKAKKTLKFMNSLQKEQNGKATAAGSALGMAQMAYKNLEDEVSKAKDVLKNTQKEKADLEKKAKDEKERLGKSEKAMMARIKAYKAAAKDMEKYKPEIVRQHGLQP